MINALGGYRDLARRLAMNPVVVWRWQERGIPSRHWPRLIELAAEGGVPGITADTLMRSRYAAEAA
jgi:hypothetical protein